MSICKDRKLLLILNVFSFAMYICVRMESRSYSMEASLTLQNNGLFNPQSKWAVNK